MVSKHKQKKKKPFKNYEKSNKEPNALIEKKIQKLHRFQEMQISDDESKKSISSFAESVVSGEISYSSSEWKIGLEELFVTCLNNNSKKNSKSN